MKNIQGHPFLSSTGIDYTPKSVNSYYQFRHLYRLIAWERINQFIIHSILHRSLSKWMENSTLCSSYRVKIFYTA